MDVYNLSGIITALASPLTPDYRIDEPALRRLIRYQLDGGVNGIFVVSSTGECPSLTEEERRRAARIAVEEAGGKVAVLVGIGDTSIQNTLDRMRYAESIGADAVVALLPYYFTYKRQEEMKAYFRIVVEEARLPVFLYNVPQTVKGFLDAPTVLEMSCWEGVAGVKDSSANFGHLVEVIAACRDNPRFRIFQGSEFILGPSVLMGAHGGVLGVTNIAPRLSVALYQAAAAGDVLKVRELQERLTAVSQVFWMAETPLGGFKAALSYLGFGGPTVAPPLREASAEPAQRIAALLKKFRDDL